MLWFKKKMPIEDFIQRFITEKLPRAVQFFDKENERAHSPVSIPDDKLLEIGAGMALFFLSQYFPDTDKANLKIMARAFKTVEKELPNLNAKPKEAHIWWKAFTDGLIFQENEARLRIACRIVWEKLIPNKPFRENSPLKAFGYFVEVEMQAARKANVS